MHLPSPLRRSPRRNTATRDETFLHPPSAFTNTTQTFSRSTFKDSLRKIPSTIFTRGDRKLAEKKSMDKMSTKAAATTAAVPEKKGKSKTRKALGGLFGWGNAQSNPPTPPPKAVPTVPAPVISAPVPARPTSARIPVPKLDKRPSILSFRSPIEKKPSIPLLEKRTSKARLAPVTPNIARTSMGEDPFGCDAGAEVVHRAVRQSVCTPSVRSEATARERRRDSTFSDRAMSTKTQGSDEVVQEVVAMRPRRVTIASVIEEKKRLSSQSTQYGSVSISDRRSSGQSHLSSNTFGNLDSIEVMSEITEVTRRALPSPRTVMFERPLPAPLVERTPLPPSAYRGPKPAAVELPTPVQEPRGKLNKAKTRSRVWGFLGKKKAEDQPVSPTEPRLALGSRVEVPERNVPILHISHPSVDVPIDSRPALSIRRSSEAVSTKLPKRKSLHGVFGLNIERERTVSDITEESPVTSTENTGIQNWQPPTIRPLSEEMAEVSFGTINDLRTSPAKPQDLRRVASATDKLISLVSAEFSPRCSPGTATLANMASFSSLKDASPTPIRRTQSAMLAGSTKTAQTPPRPASQLNPIKMVLERARVRKMEGVSMTVAEPGTPPKHNSLVKSGMRNVFAPPSPVKSSSPQSRPSIDASTIIRRPGHGPTTGLAGFIGGNEEMVGSLPADLYHMLAAAQAFADPDERTASPVPSAARGSTPAPGISLPPVPIPNDVFADNDSDSSEDEQDVRQSFDFEAHFEQLDSGDRQSFLAALSRVESRAEMRPPLPPLPTTLYTIEQSPDSVRTMRRTPPAEDTRKVSPTRARKAPFQGTFAFQQQVSKTKASSPLATEAPALTLPAPPPPPPARGHVRGQSNASFASMSSMGDVLDSVETAREYTNYFDVNFGQHLAQQQTSVSDIMAFSQAMHSRRNSVESVQSNHRAPTRRQHHRNSSIASIDSIGGMEQGIVGPPNSRFNKHRSGYVSRHRVNGSIEASWGRSDWANHKRTTSSDSTASNVSLARIGRPGLGERMFERDNGINLASIEGSPAETHSRQQSLDSVLDASPAKSEDSIVDGAANATYDSIIDGAHDQSYDSILDNPNVSFDSQVHKPDPDFTAKMHRRTDTWESTDLSAVESKRSSATASIFGVDMEAAGMQKGFFLKGVRPVSAVSRSESEASDAFIDVSKYAQKAERPKRKPGHLAIDNTFDTPGLSSPSTSETSFMSLETRFSEHIFGHQRQKSSAAVKPQATIMEEPSSATLKPRSLAHQLSRENLRKQNVQEWDDDDEDVEMVTSWLRFQREANDVCRRTRSFYRDSAESQAAVADFATNFTPQSVAQFLAQSAAAYRPLESAHRRRPSFGNTRATSSPYGLPLQKASIPCKPRGSLTTKFERSNSAQSRHSLGPSESGTDTPTSGIFDTFMPELQPAQRRSTPPSAVVATMSRASTRKGSCPPTFTGFAQNPSRLSAPPLTPSAFAVPAPMTLLAEHKEPKEELAMSPSAAARQRVSSGDRRKALGWGRRRDSDGPQNVSDIPAVPAIPLALRRTSNMNAAPRVPINNASKASNTPKLKPAVSSPRKAGSAIFSDEGSGRENSAPFARPTKPTQGRVSSRRTGNRPALAATRALRA